MKKAWMIALIVAIVLLISIVIFYKMPQNTTTKVLLETIKGNITLELYPDKAPITVENFLNYVKSGYYTDTIFHRVIDNFMIQGGGYASNGEEKQTNPPIKLESDNGLKNEKYAIAMARTSTPDSATSQFFINTVDNEFLNYGVRDEGYAVFGKVASGMEVVDAIGKVQTDSNDKPLQEIRIIKASIVK